MFEDLTVLFRVRKLLHIYTGTHTHTYIYLFPVQYLSLKFQITDVRRDEIISCIFHRLASSSAAKLTDFTVSNAERIVAFRSGAYFTRNSTADKKATPDKYRRVRTGIPGRFVARSPSGSVLKYLQRNFANESAFSRQQY